MMLNDFVGLLGHLMLNIGLKHGTRVYFPFSLFLVKTEMEGNTWCAVSAHEKLMQKNCILYAATPSRSPQSSWA